MGVRSVNHQRVGGKQYFEGEVQIGGFIQGVNKEVITGVTGATLDQNQSGATILLGADVDVFLPTPTIGLNYKFVMTASAGGSKSVVTATSDGSTAATIFFGNLDINGTASNFVDKDTLEFLTGGAEGDWAEVVCVSSSTTNTDPVWHVSGACGTASCMTMA